MTLFMQDEEKREEGREEEHWKVNMDNKEIILSKIAEILSRNGFFFEK